jgi:membrane-bound serine protease (ClpP class)
MDIVDSIKLILNNPNVAYLLLILSILGISIEILTPGLIFPSTIGILLGILAFFGLSSLDINFLGLTLIILSLAFFIAEAVFRKKGLIALLGAAVILTGSFFPFHRRDGKSVQISFTHCRNHAGCSRFI